MISLALGNYLGLFYLENRHGLNIESVLSSIRELLTTFKLYVLLLHL